MCGFGHTKTLAKIANYIAKNKTTDHLYLLYDAAENENILSELSIERIWGIGSGLTKRLNKLGIYTAKQLRDADANMLRLHSSVTLVRTLQELRGISCIEVESIQPRKQIISSRSFGRPVTKLDELEEAVSHYAVTASLKLRKQQCVTNAVYVFLQTNMFNEKDKQYSNGATFPFPIPTADTSYIIRIAKKCLRHIYKKGYKYHKAGIMLLDLSPAAIKQYDFLAQSTQKSELLMQTVDAINAEFGKNTIFYGAEGIIRPWQIKFEERSARYTTRWNELTRVLC